MYDDHNHEITKYILGTDSCAYDIKLIQIEYKARVRNFITSST